MAFSLKQQIIFRQLVAAAWAAHCKAEFIVPHDAAAKDQWYRKNLREATGVNSTKLANPRTHFVPAMARFERIAGQDIFWQTRNGGPDDDRLRRLRYALDTLMRERDISQEYATGVLRQMYDTNDWNKLRPEQLEAVITALKRQLGIYVPKKLKLKRKEAVHA